MGRIHRFGAGTGSTKQQVVRHLAEVRRSATGVSSFPERPYLPSVDASEQSKSRSSVAGQDQACTGEELVPDCRTLTEALQDHGQWCIEYWYRDYAAWSPFIHRVISVFTDDRVRAAKRALVARAPPGNANGPDMLTFLDDQAALHELERVANSCYELVVQAIHGRCPAWLTECAVWALFAQCRYYRFPDLFIQVTDILETIIGQESKKKLCDQGMPVILRLRELRDEVLQLKDLET